MGYIRQPEFLTFNVRLHRLIYMFLILHIADGIAVFCRKPSIAFYQSDIMLQHLLIRQIYTIHRTHMYPGLDRLRDIFKIQPGITGKYRHTKSFIISMRFLPGILQRRIACLRDIGDLHTLCPQILQADQFDAKSGYAVLHGSCLCRIAGTV